jgi:hypothetical protein
MKTRKSLRTTTRRSYYYSIFYGVIISTIALGTVQVD